MIKRFLQFAVLTIVATSIAHGDVIERVVALVNNQPILQSDLEQAIRFESLDNTKPLDSAKAAYDREALDRLIDQEILRQQMRGYKMAPVAPTEVQAELQNLRRQVAAGNDERLWHQSLLQAGLSEQEVLERLTAQLEILHFLNTRLRPSIRVERTDIESYYRNTLIPQIEKAGGKRVPMGQVAAEIQEVLVQQRMGDALNDWLRMLRAQSDIQVAPVNGSPLAAETR